MKDALLFLFLSLSFNILKAQDFPYGNCTPEEISMTKYDKDPLAHAVVLKEFGKTWLSSGQHIPLVFEYHVKIKIFDEQGFNQGDINIPLYKASNNLYEEVSEIQAIACYKDENGNVQKVELSPEKIFHINQNRYWDAVKFAIPGLHKGCIIEYKYHLETPFIQNFRPWPFQAYIPKMYSEYEAHIPAVYNYNVSLRGPYQLSKTETKLERDCFAPNGSGLKCDCSQITYIMKDIPAFVPEADMTSPKNFMSAINFELKDYYNINSNTKVKVAQEWEDIDDGLKHADQFGAQIKKSGLLKDKLQTVIEGRTNELSKAKAVYNYIQKTFRFNGIIGFASNDGIKKAMENGSGSIADINLSLINALNTVGIRTGAVLLSTRDNGIVNKLYPVVTNFNYVVAKADIGDKSYLLDATDPQLPFGLLPLRCINGQGRVISMDKPSYWIYLTASQKKTRTYTFDLTLQDDGKIKGTMINYSYGYEAYDKRKMIKKFNSTDEYVDDLDNRLKPIKIVKSEINNLDSLDKPLTEVYEIEMNGPADMNADKFSFDPFFIDKVPENPFKLPVRTYPVDLGAEFDDRFSLVLHFPKQFTVASVPENISLNMPADGGKFLLDCHVNGDSLSFSHVTQFTRAIYLPEEYVSLKEMFNKIIQAQNGEIVFKKNK